MVNGACLVDHRFDLDERLTGNPRWSRGQPLRQTFGKSKELVNFSPTSAVEDLLAELKHITQRRKRKQQRCS